MLPETAVKHPAEEPVWAAFVGIDWACKRHAWCLQPAGSSKIEKGFVDNTPEAIAQWAAELDRHFGGSLIAVALEQKRGSVVNLLCPYSHLVLFPVPPTMSSTYRKAFVPSGAKNDPGDAAWILDLLVHHRDRLQRLEPEDDLTRLLLFLVEERRRLVDDKTRQILRLKDCLQQYFPQLEKWFDVDTSMAAALLDRWPDLQQLQHSHPGTIRKFLHQHHCRKEEAIQKHIHEIYAAIPATHDSVIREACSSKARHLMRRIALLRDQIAELEQRREEIVAQHPDAPIFASFPGAGPATVPRLIVAFGTRRQRFASASDVECDSGIAPVHVTSGKVDRVSFRRACQKFKRQTFQEFAGQSMATCQWAKAYYEEHCHQPQQHHAVERSLAFKWIRIMFRCWKDRVPYNEELYLNSLRRRSSLVGAKLAAVTTVKWKKVAGFSKLSDDFS